MNAATSTCAIFHRVIAQFNKKVLTLSMQNSNTFKIATSIDKEIWHTGGLPVAGIEDV